MTCLTCLDGAWLLDSGETVDNIATRLGYIAPNDAKRRAAIYRHLKVHNRHDLLTRLTERTPT